REEVFKIIETLRNSFTNYNRIEIDGIKIVTNSYAFLVRPSGTEPLIRITVESWDRDIAERVLTELISIIQKSRGDIN
ncbi:MAG: phosphoglucosamine mutase, partial [Ignisphaera sp.]